MDTKEPTIININAFPTPKEQIVGGLVGIGISAASVLIFFGGAALIGKVVQMKEDRKARKTSTEPTE